MKEGICGVRYMYGFDVDFFDYGNENEAKVIRLDPIVISSGASHY
jgi:hypothetical protein